jgi:hypothetical protein
VNGTVDITDLSPSVELVGQGVIEGTGTVETLFIAPSAVIQADGLLIDTHLELGGSSSLSATENGTINLGNEVDLKLSSATSLESLPKLDLGLIGRSYSIVPHSLVVDVGLVNMSNPILDTVKVPLVQGRSLDNCEEWGAHISWIGAGDARLTTKCETEGSESRLLGLDPLVTLFVVKVEDPPTSPPGNDPDDQTGMIVGIVVAVVVVVVGVVVAVVFLTRRSKDKGESVDSSLSSSGD